jgi:hypothetical protein
MEPEIGPKQTHPATVILITLGAFFLVFQVVGPIIAFMMILPFSDLNTLEMAQAMENPVTHPELKIPLLFMQGFGALLGLIITPLIILKKTGNTSEPLFRGKVYAQPLLIVVATVISFLAVNSVFIQWNQGITLPPGIEEWARSFENRATELTKYLTTFDSFGQVIFAFIVIAIIPAIGEELVFRGIIQRQFYKSTKNTHVSIWLGAAIFSIMHFQLYGFVPRMFLGALFGYLYYWSGNIIMPMVAHFINNGMIVVAMYLYQQKLIDVDMESNEAAPWSAVLVSAIITGVLLYVFKKFYEKKQTEEISHNTTAADTTIIP